MIRPRYYRARIDGANVTLEVPLADLQELQQVLASGDVSTAQNIVAAMLHSDGEEAPSPSAAPREIDSASADIGANDVARARLGVPVSGVRLQAAGFDATWIQHYERLTKRDPQEAAAWLEGGLRGRINRVASVTSAQLMAEGISAQLAGEIVTQARTNPALAANSLQHARARLARPNNPWAKPTA